MQSACVLCEDYKLSSCTCKDCSAWAAAEDALGLDWLHQVNTEIKCPCHVEPTAIPSDWFMDPSCNPASPSRCDKFHPGAFFCTLSRKVIGNAGQQCCYLPDGSLILDGPGAGTPDKHAVKWLLAGLPRELRAQAAQVIAYPLEILLAYRRESQEQRQGALRIALPVLLFLFKSPFLHWWEDVVGYNKCCQSCHVDAECAKYHGHVRKPDNSHCGVTQTAVREQSRGTEAVFDEVESEGIQSRRADSGDAAELNTTFPVCTEAHCPDMAWLLCLCADLDGDQRLTLPDLMIMADVINASSTPDVAAVFDALDTSRDAVVRYNTTTGELDERPPSFASHLARAGAAWERSWLNELKACQENRTWDELQVVEGWWTGGLGKLMTAEYEVWVCFPNHGCAATVAHLSQLPISAKTAACFVFNEVSETWVFWRLEN
eukprot:1813496-Rhodomonas_salina.1